MQRNHTTFDCQCRPKRPGVAETGGENVRRGNVRGICLEGNVLHPHIQGGT